MGEILNWFEKTKESWNDLSLSTRFFIVLGSNIPTWFIAAAIWTIVPANVWFTIPACATVICLVIFVLVMTIVQGIMWGEDY